MGCDVSTTVHVREGSRWVKPTDEPCLDTRWYPLFSRLAGIRSQPSDPPPLAPERGRPSDDPRQRWPGDGPDACTWYTLDELLPIREEYGETWAAFLSECEALAGDPKLVRITFEFWS